MSKKSKSIINNQQLYLPKGFDGLTFNAGLKEIKDDDCLLVRSTISQTISEAMFTQSLFAGPSVELSKNHSENNFRALVVLAKNANVATGSQGREDARELRRLAANLLGLKESQVLVASTGVIGQVYPLELIRKRFSEKSIVDLQPLLARKAASAIMTTDTQPKYFQLNCDFAQIVGIAKGVGMIEPDMATLLTFFFTDADLNKTELTKIFRAVINKTFNATSIDTDTSTSDTAAIFANGLAGRVCPIKFQETLEEVALALVKMVISDAEGGSKSIIVQVRGARDNLQAKRVAKSIVNSPLVKTAIHGADPNWGRVLMAIGKLNQETDIIPEKITVSFGDIFVYPQSKENQQKDSEHLRQYLSGDLVEIKIDLKIGEGEFTVYGCDLSCEYVRINADYTT